MPELAPAVPRLPAMGEDALAKVRRLEERALALPQATVATTHVLHAGLYARTVCVPAGTMITGALVKIATLLVIQGDVMVWLDGQSIRLTGYNVLPASAHRKQAFLAAADTHITMIFASAARTVGDAEQAFTDEAACLASRRATNANTVIITGE